MKELLALYNIKTVHFFDNGHMARNFAFSKKMLANNIFIEHYAAGGLDEDEDEFAEDDEMEDDEMEDDELEDDEQEDDEMEDDAQYPEHGSQLSIVMEHKKKYYQFLMYHSTYEIGLPVMVLQTIVFLVDLIEKVEPGQLIDYISGIAIEPLIPHEIPEKDFRDAANKMLKLKIKFIHDLISEDNADLN